MPIIRAGNMPVDKNTISQIKDLADIGKFDNTESHSVSSMKPYRGMKIGCRIIDIIRANKFILKFFTQASNRNIELFAIFGHCATSNFVAFLVKYFG